MSGHTVIKPPKTRAGKRTVAISPNIVPLLSGHADEFVGDQPESLVFDSTDRSLGVAWRSGTIGSSIVLTFISTTCVIQG